MFAGTNGGTCTGSGFEGLTELADCGNIDQIADIGPHLDPELKFTSDGDIEYDNGQPKLYGIRASGPSAIGNGLATVKTWFDAAYPNLGTPKPRTFVIVLTDGEDDCSGSGDAGARAAAAKAQALYNATAVDPAMKVPTFVIAFGNGVADSKTRANMIAWAGDGLKWTDWSKNPTETDAATGCDGRRCRDALIAEDKGS